MKDDDTQARRKFLKSLAGLTAGIMAGPMACQGKPSGSEAVNSKDQEKNSKTARENKGPKEKDRLGELLPQRAFGSTGEFVTMLGLGGAHIARMDEKEAQRTIEAALEGGVRFFDNAESYGSGTGEERYGKFLNPKYRDIAYVMSKTTAKDSKTAQQHLEGTLRRMNTDYLDLWLVHAVTSPGDVDGRLSNGVLDVVLEAQASGKVRHIGFSGHSDFNAHLRMLESTDVLQACQMPINVFDTTYKSFINNVMPKLVEKKMAPLAMKTLANGGFFGGTSHFNHGDNPKIIPNSLSIEEAVHFSWSLPISVLITGAENADMIREKIQYARSFIAFDEDQRQRLINKVADGGYDGQKVEYYKV